MTDSNDQDRKKVLSLPGKGKLELKNKPAADSSVRQSFSHGRSKTVTVEVALAVVPFLVLAVMTARSTISPTCWLVLRTS